MLRQGKSFSGRERNCLYLNTGDTRWRAVGVQPPDARAQVGVQPAGARAQPLSDRIGDFTRFANVSAVSGFDFPDDARGLGRVDWDFDGKTDVWVTNRSGPNLRFLRNTIENKNHFVAVRLTGNGTTTNRDAIGARVEVVLQQDQEQRRVKTVRAGDGFLSQSSRWLIFGLGQNDSIKRVIVHWPGADAMVAEYSNIETDQWYEIHQGVVDAKVWSPPAIDLTTAPPTQNLARPSFQRRTFLAGKIPVPRGRWETFDGDQLPIIKADETKATLVVLWATWCLPCAKELRELEAQRSELESAGVRVLALCVDDRKVDDRKVDDRKVGGKKVGGKSVNQTDPHDPQRDDADGAVSPADFIDHNRIKFEAGWVSPSLMETLHLVDEYVFNKPRDLPVPTSFLLDSKSNLVAIYKGPVDVQQLTQDALAVDALPSRRLELATPLAGIWSAHYGRPDLRPLKDMFAKRGRWNEVTMIVRQMLEQNPSSVELCSALCQLLTTLGKQDEAIELSTRKANGFPDQEIDFRLIVADVQISARRFKEARETLSWVLAKDPKQAAALLRMGFCFQDQGDWIEAVDYFQQALASDPSLLSADIETARSLAASGQWELATSRLAKIIEQHPQLAEPHLILAKIYLERKNTLKAETCFQRALKLDATNPATHFSLGGLLEEKGETDSAMMHYQKAAELRRGHTTGLFDR